MEHRSLRTDDCLDTVIKFYSDMVYRLAFARTGSRYDADDIYQEVFMRYINRRPHFESEEHRKAWLIKVTVNCSKNYWASLKRRKTESLELLSEQFSEPQSEPQSEPLSDQLSDLRHNQLPESHTGPHFCEEFAFETPEDTNLYHGLQQLPRKYREVVHLFYYEDMSIEEIGQVLERKEATVRTQLTRARQKLRATLTVDTQTRQHDI